MFNATPMKATLELLRELSITSAAVSLPLSLLSATLWLTTRAEPGSMEGSDFCLTIFKMSALYFVASIAGYVASGVAMRRDDTFTRKAGRIAD